MALLGANVQCNGYFPGYYSTRDLIFDSEGSTWTSSNAINELRSDCYHMGSLPISSHCTLFGYDKELLKQTILKHEAILRDQIHDLHRVYHKQKELMNEIKRNELYKHNLRLEISCASSSLSSMNAQKICCSPNLPRSGPQPSVLIAESVQLPLASAQEKSRQIYPAPLTITEYKPSQSKYRKIGKKILDLQLPADEYIDSEEGEKNERVTEVHQVSAYSLNGISKVVCDSHDKTYGTNSRGFTDLNVPFKLGEEAAANSCDLGPTTHHSNNPFYDLSRRTTFGSQNLANDVMKNLNKRKDRESCSDNSLPDHEKKHEWLYSGQSSGLLEQFNDVPCFHSLHQINRGPWTERKISSSANCVQTQGPTRIGLLGPSSASHARALHQVVSGADMINSEISPAELRKAPVSDFGQNLLAVQASSASFSQSSKSLIEISGSTRDELYQARSVKSGPNLDGQNFLLSCFSSSSKLLDHPSVNTNDPNNRDNHSSLDSHELRKYIEGSKDLGTPKNLNLNIMPAVYSDSTAFQSMQITQEENKYQDSTRGLPWLKGKPVGKEKPNGESNLSTDKTLVFHRNGKSQMSSDMHSFNDFPSEVFQNQSKNQRIEEIEKGCISDIKSPSAHVLDLGVQIPIGENLMKNEKKHESLASIIDLNSSMIEDDNMLLDVDFHAPASPENKECSPPRGESDENQLELPFKLTEQKDPEVQEEQIKIAAEALVSISGFVAQEDLQMTTCSSSESFVSNPLHWFAGIVSKSVDHPENEIKVDFCGKVNDIEEFLNAEMDYFEFMTLKLTETDVLGCCCKTISQSEQMDGSTSPTRPKKGSRSNRRRWRKDFQSEILPSLASLSRYEVTEDLQTIGGLVAASTHSETGSLRSASRDVLGRGRKRSCTSTSNITDILLNLKQQTSITTLGIEKRGLISWGNTCKKKRGQRLPSTDPRFILSQVYN